MGDSNVLQFRASDEGVGFVQALMAEHSRSRTEVLRAMFAVASQFPDLISKRLNGDHSDGLSGFAAARAKLKH